ncbi:hypothetical protein RGU70_05275 [Herbaspirillum sp. RTI4]|uniref:hypothetical protein n=1 Tax=Herbaspirillum sp. RTI4 TaxID=3048640 RepID=UPI002AB34016|nr:hypothetical protein [Herbaspirillum sp. RTI4]MDY7577728.1 hypothetical protein [Herbaspirillum sp. RTI4]MEA9980844.1 hypothetical protein [Herbaspirillum sp. RTI4]
MPRLITPAHLAGQTPSASLRRRILYAMCLLAATIGQPVSAEQAVCNLVVGNPEYDLGSIAPAQVNQQRLAQGLVSLGKQNNTLNVLCIRPTRFALYFRGAQGAGGEYRANNSPKAATLRLTLSQGQTDGQPVTWVSTLDASRTAHTMPLMPGAGLRPQIAGADVPLTRLSTTVEIETLFDVTQLKSGADQDLAGEGVFEIVPF